MKLSEAAGLVSLRCVRDADFDDLAHIGHADGRALVYAADGRALDGLGRMPQAVAVVTTAELASRVADSLGIATADRPEAAFYAVHRALHATDFYWKDFPTEIHASARVHERAYVAPQSVRIGADVVIEPYATILERVSISEGSIIRAGAVIGAEGFEFKGPAMRQGRASRRASDYGSTNVAVPHAGSVEIGARVEIQANSTVDRSLFRWPTRIGDDTKIDNLVHIAHSVRVGARCLIAAGVTFAGSVITGDEVWIGPHAVISSGVRLGDGAAVVIGATVTKHVGPGERVASDLRQYRLS